MIANSEVGSNGGEAQRWVEGTFPHKVSAFSEALNKLSLSSSCCLIWNEKLLGFAPEIESWAEQAVDLFEAAPPNIRQEYSLSLAVVRTAEAPHESLFQLLSLEGTCLLFFDSSLGELLEAKSLSWGWFMQPSNLPALFGEAEPELRNELSKGLTGLLVIASDRGCGFLYSGSGDVPAVAR